MSLFDPEYEKPIAFPTRRLIRVLGVIAIFLWLYQIGNPSMIVATTTKLKVYSYEELNKVKLPIKVNLLPYQDYTLRVYLENDGVMDARVEPIVIMKGGIEYEMVGNIMRPQILIYHEVSVTNPYNESRLLTIDFEVVAP